ncbi:cytochrome c oxidase subunit 3 [Streptomyces sp. NBC_00562]|nr:cytochrome c oxidase subunit 3 [Streptomyces sp. NBC_00562]WUC22801.1 cytochrome c oxidase subunit 3 [Streptomyces sp. NBC_00562]
MTTTTDVPDEPPPRASPARHIPGETGLWILLLGDMTVFAVLFLVYLQHRGHHPALFAASQSALNGNLATINTLVLLSSSVLVVLATRVARTPQRHYAPRFLVGAIALGLAFVGIKAIEYHHLFAAGITSHMNSFFVYYFTLTGLHLAHLCAGMFVLAVLLTLSRKRELTTGQYKLFEGGACFWHMLDLIWLIIFPLVFLVR